MKREASSTVTAVVADLVASRDVPDRGRLHRRVVEVLERANERTGPVSPFRVTVGDEFQGTFERVGQALRATLWIRLALLGGDPAVDVRFGLGRGEVTAVDAAAGIEDGSAWWAARDAVVAVEAQAARPGLQHRRTAYRSAAPDGPPSALVDALLVCRDQVVGPLSVRSARLLLGVLDGTPQLELAAAEGISASAVSRRVRHDGLAALLVAEDLLTEV